MTNENDFQVAELGDILEVDLGGLMGLTRFKIMTQDSVELANDILSHETGWGLIKDEDV